MAAERTSAPRRGEVASDRDPAGQHAHGGPQHTDHDGRALGADLATQHGADHSNGGRAHDAIPSSVQRFAALVDLLERRGLLDRATSIHSGDLDVKLTPLGPKPPPAPERDRLKEGDEEKEKLDEVMYGSS